MPLNECDRYKEGKPMGSRKKYHFFFSKKLLIFMLAGITLAFVLVFILGFLCGEGVHKDRMLSVEVEDSVIEERQTKDEISTKTKRDSDKDPKDMELTFYQTLLKKEGVSHDQRGAVKIPSQVKKNKKQVKQRKKAKRVFNQRDENAESLSGYTVQIGSFQSKEQAKKLADNLDRKGYPAYIVSTDIPMQGIWHRVRVGHFETMNNAKRFRVTLEMKENLPTYITFISK